MSIIGTLETLPLPLLLRRIEAFTKTGLMTITQGMQSVELYFRKGLLMCVGPVRTDVSIAERLLQDGMISPLALQDVVQVHGDAQVGETRIALTLMEMGHIKREDLRAWMTKKVTDVLYVLLNWKNGSIDFVENVEEPVARLLVSLSISALLDAQTATPNPALQLDMEFEQDVASLSSQQEEYEAIETQMMHVSKSIPVLKQEPLPVSRLEVDRPSSPYQSLQSGRPLTPTLSNPDISQARTLYEASQFMAKPTESPLPFSSSELLSSLSVPNVPETAVPASSYLDSSILFSGLDDLLDIEPNKALQAISPVATPAPLAPYYPPRQVDTSFMQPDMVMVPAQSSRGDDRILITQEQWQLLTRVDGQTPLRQICVEQRISFEHVRQAAGELIAQGLVHVVYAQSLQSQPDSGGALTSPSTPMELSPASRQLVTAGLHNGFVVPGSYASVAPSWGDGLPVSQMKYLSPSYETQSQWGNSGNGVSFVAGQGWTAPPMPLQPLPSSGPLAFISGAYPTMQRR